MLNILIIAENNISNANLHLMFDKIIIEETGEGWFYAHIRGITKFAKNNKTLISVKAMETISAISKGFTKMWTKTVKQMQVPPFALNTKGAWFLRFDDIIADALELGAE